MKQLLFVAIMLTSTVLAYGRTISGEVTNGRTGEPLVGAMIMNGDRGTVTDLDGKYQIEARTGDKLTYQYVGYLSVEKTVDISSTINVGLKTTTGDMYLDVFADGTNEVKEQIEAMFKSQYGIDMSIAVDIDSDKHEIVYIYEFYDKSIYDAYDITNGIEGVLNGVISGAMQGDSSESELEFIVDRFESNKYNIRVLVKYGNQSKSGLITFKDLRIRANAALGK